MKTEQEIKERIVELKTQVLKLKEGRHNAKDHAVRGEYTDAIYEVNCEIKGLEWVLNEQP